MAVSSSGFPILQRQTVIIALICHDANAAADWSRWPRQETTQCGGTRAHTHTHGDGTRVHLGNAALFLPPFFSHSVSPSPPPRLRRPFRLYSRVNQWQTSVYCLFPAQATALLWHPPLQKCFFPSVPLLITSPGDIELPVPRPPRHISELTQLLFIPTNNLVMKYWFPDSSLMDDIRFCLINCAWASNLHCPFPPLCL